MPKRVFVLGAGFSKAANFPLQSEMLAMVTDSVLIGGADILSDPDGPTQIFLTQREQLVQFLERTFRGGEQRLEDVFTLLDQAIVEHSTFAGYDVMDLIKIRDLWVRAILFCLHKCSEQHLGQPASIYVRFAMWLIRQRLKAGLSGDSFSILSLNWDSLLEDSLFHVIREVDALGQIDVDYCVYTTPLHSDSTVCPHVPSPKQRAQGIYNVKLLKLHGSATWLRCPNSGLVYTGLGMADPASTLYFLPRPSPFMLDYPNDGGGGAEVPLEPYIITPTYSKVFDLPHIKTTWQNAFVELREATEVIFVGYSLPDADYHFRALLLRAIRPTTRVRVFLSAASDPATYSSSVERETLPNIRYRRLFGDLVVFDYGGVEALVGKLSRAEAEGYSSWIAQKLQPAAAAL